MCQVTPKGLQKEIATAAEGSTSLRVSRSFSSKLLVSLRCQNISDCYTQFQFMDALQEEWQSKEGDGTCVVAYTAATYEGRRVRQFTAVMMTWRASKNFFEASTKVVVLDACHLRMKVLGNLFLAVGHDANGQESIIAAMVGGTESASSWGRFLRFFVRAIGTPTVTVSDRDKGLAAAAKKVLPDVAHTNCALHLARNLKFGTKQFVLTNLARAVSKEVFRDLVCEYKKDESTASHIAKLEKSGISKSTYVSAFVPAPRFGVVTGNPAEVMNAALKDARNGPVLQCILNLHKYVQETRVKRLEAALRNDHPSGLTERGQQLCKVTAASSLSFVPLR